MRAIDRGVVSTWSDERLEELAQLTILIVDDQPMQVKILQRLLTRAGYERIEATTRAEDVPERCARRRPDLLLLDLHMPGMDGFEVMARLRPLIGAGGLPIVVLSGDDSVEARRRALADGARDFISKPFDQAEVLARVRNVLEMRLLQLRLQDQNELLKRRVAARTAELEQARRELLERLALVAEYRDYATGEHTRRVGTTAGLLARELELPSETVETIREAAALHDIGKLGVSDAILLKAGPLDPAERREMSRHVELGAEILGDSQSPVLRLAEEIALSHHERWDGGGYPAGACAEAIPISGRITAIADVFDALTHRRPYKPASSLEAAVAEIEAQAGRHFDPRLVAAFSRLDHAALL
jgi:putative two-component system response regulator